MTKLPSAALFLALFVASSVVTLHAQAPELTADNSIRPLLGNDVTAVSYPSTSPGELTPIAAVRGENQTWDISSFSFGQPTEFTSEYREPPLDDLPGWRVWALAPNPPNYANVARDVIDENIPDTVELAFMHYVDDTQLLNLGFSGLADATEDGVLDTVIVGNDPASVEFKFPTRFGDEWTSEWEQAFLVLGGPSFTGGTAIRTKKVVGWGTLNTPMGSAEVLQLEETFKLTAFGNTLVDERSIQFLGPFQEAPGKRGLVSVSLRLILGAGDAVVSAEHSMIELDGGGDPTAIERLDEVPTGFEISANYPNPFNPSTTLQFAVPHSGRIMMTVHDVMGRQVDLVADEFLSAGSYAMTWEAIDLPSGLYSVRLTLDGETRTRSVVLQK